MAKVNIPYMGLRAYKLKTTEGWKHSRSSITNEEQLKRWMSKYNVIKAYMTNSYWLNPSRLEGKELKAGGYPIAQRCFLGSDLVFDLDRTQKIDGEEIVYDWETVRTDALHIIRHMEREQDFKIWGIWFSGRNGLHIRYHQDETYYAEDPLQRRELYKQERIKLINRLPDLSTLDKDITIDPFRITKIPDTFDMSTGYKVQYIPLEQLRTSSMNTILESIERCDEISSHRDGPMGHRQKIEEIDRPRIRSSPHFYKWISNKVFGAKDRYCIFALITKGRFNEMKLISLGYKYKMGDLFLFDAGKFIQVIGLKAVSSSRLKKILRKLNASNLNEFERCGFSRIRTSQVIGGDKDPAPKPMKVLCCSELNGQHSLPHWHYIQSFGPILFEYENCIGSKFDKIYEMGVI